MNKINMSKKLIRIVILSLVFSVSQSMVSKNLGYCSIGNTIEAILGQSQAENISGAEDSMITNLLAALNGNQATLIYNGSGNRNEVDSPERAEIATGIAGSLADLMGITEVMPKKKTHLKA